MASAVLMIIGGYLLGAIPTANICARLFKGVDLRNYGSGSVTSSNAGRLMGRKALAVIGVLDIFKGTGPVWVAMALDLSLSVQMAIGIAAIAGHNWSIFLGFEGGRGLTTSGGVMLAIAQVQLGLLSLVAFFGVAFFRNVPINIGVAFVLVPVWSAILGAEAPIIWGTSIMVALLMAKRLTGNQWGTLPAQGKGRVLLYRFLYDRDTKDRIIWIARNQGEPRASNP